MYSNKQDGALFWSEIFNRNRSLGTHADPILVPQSSTCAEFVDVIDTTDMDQNVHSLRHSYFNLNMQIIGDIVEIIRTELPARMRFRSLVKRNPKDNVHSFLCPPSFMNADRGF